ACGPRQDPVVLRVLGNGGLPAVEELQLRIVVFGHLDVAPSARSTYPRSSLASLVEKEPAMAKIKAYKFGASDEPAFPGDFEIVKKAVLQVTDIKTNRNKYYAIELHVAGGKYRVFTHYGRTDDLETNPDAGQKETRHLDSLAEAEGAYLSIYREKTS